MPATKWPVNEIEDLILLLEKITLSNEKLANELGLSHVTLLKFRKWDYTYKTKKAVLMYLWTLQNAIRWVIKNHEDNSWETIKALSKNF